jgi:thiol-disulfide isomerase/thioredoxin
MSYLSSKRVFGNKFFSLVVVFSTISCFLPFNFAFCDVVFTNNKSKDQQKDNIKNEIFFDQIKKGSLFLEPKSLFFDKDGKSYNLFEFRNKLLLIYFWASWCNNCVEELKNLDALKQELNFREIKDLEILPISIDFKDRNTIASVYLSKNIKHLPLFFDPKKELMNSFNIKNLPHVILINEKGYVILETRQTINWKNEEFINKLLALRGTYSQESIPQLEKENDINPENHIILKQEKSKPIIIN